MSSDATLTSAMANPPADDPSGQQLAPRPTGFFETTIRNTLTNIGARIGLTWIAIVVIAGIFAPFIASSYPIVMRQNGQLSSPILHKLDYVDVSLVFLAAVAALLIAVRKSMPRNLPLLLFIVSIAVTVPIAYALFPRQELTQFNYREDLKDGLIESATFTLIPYSPNDRQNDQPVEAKNQPPGWHHLFGTTNNKEDVLSRMIHGARTAVSVGFVSTGIAVMIGVTIGGLMGYFAGKVDIIGMRLIEIFESIPALFLIIMFVTFYGRNLYIIMAIIGLVGWTGNARFIRAEFFRLREQDFVHAARAAGLPLRSILFKHMLPNGITPVLISASFGVASAILTESYLAFLGLGPIDSPSWGKMLDDARGQGTVFKWWLAIFPGGAIFLTVFAYNLIGEAVRDALDPKLRKRE